MKRRNKKYLADIALGENGKANPVILRIILGDDCTQIDFGYAALSIYQKGGWIRISPETFIQVQGSEKRYPLQHAKNIALAPNKIEFESTQDWRVFSLFFEPIPMKDCVIDLVEELKPSPHDFNYYGIKVKTSTAVLLEDALL